MELNAEEWTVSVTDRHKDFVCISVRIDIYGIGCGDERRWACGTE